MEAAKKLTDRVRWSVSFFIADRVVDATRKQGTGSWSFVAAALLCALAVNSIQSLLESYFKPKSKQAWGAVFLESFDTCASIVTFISASLIVELFSEAWVKLPAIQAVSVTWCFIIVISIGVRWLFAAKTPDDPDVGAPLEAEAEDAHPDSLPTAPAPAPQTARRRITYRMVPQTPQ
jgi:hypothetical protein